MYQSYVRIRLPLAESLLRFAEWIKLSAAGPPENISWYKMNDVACYNGDWRYRAVLFVYESGEWTVFDDQSGYLSTRPSDDWLELAGENELVFAGYNDSIPSGHLIAIQQRRIIREFLMNESNPESDADRGRMEFEGLSPIKDWVGVASFVDDDEIMCSPDDGLLWMFGER